MSSPPVSQLTPLPTDPGDAVHVLTVPRVTYADRDPFGRAVKVAVMDYLREEGVAHRGGAALWSKAVVITTWFVASYALLVWVPLSLPLVALATVSLGLAMAGMAMSIKHDAIHQTFSRRPKVNGAVAHVATVYGLSIGWWQQKHNRFHHGFTNVDGVDDDLDQGLFNRLSPRQTWHPWHRWQHLYMWALYPFLFYLSGLLGADVVYVVSGRIGRHQVEPPSVRRSAVLLAAKFKGPALLLGVALVFQPAQAVLAVFMAAALIMGTVWALNIVIEHTVDTAIFPVADPGSGRVGVGWAEAQVRGSANLVIHNRLLRWYVGSLNHHIEHHLFPKIAHVHLHEIAPIVRRVCHDYGVPYHEFPTLRAALAAHHRFLRDLGRAPVAVTTPVAA